MRPRSTTSLLRQRGWTLSLVAAPLAALAASIQHRLGARPHGIARIGISPVGGVLVMIAAAAVVWVTVRILRTAVRRRRRSEDELQQSVTWHPGTRSQLLALLVLVPVVVTPTVLLMAIARSHPGISPAAPTQPGQPTPASAERTGTHSPTHGVPGLDTGMIVVVVAVLVFAGAINLIAYRRRRQLGFVTHEPTSPEPSTFDEDLRRGAEALASTDDVRLAITRCYAAMQRALDEAGVARSPVRTPSEVLSDAVGRGLLPPEPATALTRLFERARFSSEELTARDRAAAQSSLEALRGRQVSR